MALDISSGGGKTAALLLQRSTFDTPDAPRSAAPSRIGPGEQSGSSAGRYGPVFPHFTAPTTSAIEAFPVTVRIIWFFRVFLDRDQERRGWQGYHVPNLVILTLLLRKQPLQPVENALLFPVAGVARGVCCCAAALGIRIPSPGVARHRSGRYRTIPGRPGDANGMYPPAPALPGLSGGEVSQPVTLVVPGRPAPMERADAHGLRPRNVLNFLPRIGAGRGVDGIPD